MIKISMTRYRHFKDFAFSSHRLLHIFLVVLAAVLLPHSMWAYDFQACKDCHGDVLNKDWTRENIHTPFMERQCEECHVTDEATPQQETESGGLTAGQINQQKIKWLMDSGMESTSHVFLLAGDKLGDTLVVEVHTTDGKVSKQEIALPSLDGLAEVDDSGKPPTISELKVLNVQHGVFISATIGWQTDSIADAVVRYGNPDLSQTSKPRKRFGRQHQVVLSGLKPDTTYRLTAVSQDLFGRSQISEPLTFTTSESFTNIQPDSPENLPGSRNVEEIISSFKRLGSDYLLELTLEQTSSVFIGSAEREGLPNDEFHAGLSSELVSSMEACLSCHDAHLHPVNVIPTKPGIVIPPEFPTLPDGRITCVSCHAPHSSDYSYFTRKHGMSELCVSCHQKLINMRKNSNWR